MTDQKSVSLNRIDLDRNREHIERHLHGHPSKGSKFARWLDYGALMAMIRRLMGDESDDGVVVSGGILSSPGAIVRVEADGHVKVLVSMSNAIGTQGVVKISDLPLGTPVTREQRGAGEDAYEVNVVRIEPPTTCSLVLDFYDARDGLGWYLYSAFPGILTPPLQDEQFWRRHAFVALP